MRVMDHTDSPARPPCDVIIVLGAAVWPNGQPSPALRHRMAHAIEMLHVSTGQKLLVTGGMGKHPPAEAQVMRQLALEAGVPATHIVMEEHAVSTLQSARRCASLLHQHGWSNALLVTDRYHLSRALLIFRALGIQAWGSAPQGGPYSRKRWKRWYYFGRETLAFAWYVCLSTGLRVQRLRRQAGG
jgi:vancomycin permeability regulator SanA